MSVTADPWLVAADLLDPPAEPYVDDPVGFVREVLGGYPWSKQREILESVRDHKRTAVRSGHGVGKTKSAAWVALWFLYSHRNSRVITTAPTWTQVKDLLWREIRTEHAAAEDLRGECHHLQLELDSDWVALGLSTDKPERFQGHHAEHMLLIVDEASGVDRAIFEAAEGFMTGEHARVLLIGNPTQMAGQFYDAHHSERALWNCLHVNVLESPNFTGEKVPADVARQLPAKEWVEDKKVKWGEGSPIWDVRVEGKFNSQADDTVIGLAAIEAAQRREVAPHPYDDTKVVSCDVARFGSDETVFAFRHGEQVRIIETYVGRATTHTAGRLVHHFRELEADHTVVDDTGVGGGVTDMVREQGVPVEAFNGGETALEPDEYPNRRSELWFVAGAELANADLDQDEQLAADLSAPKWKMDSKGRRVVEPKDETKKRLGRSPDRGDAVLLTYAAVGQATMEVW